MDRDAKRTPASQTGDKACQKRNLPVITLDATVGIWAENGGILEVRRFGVLDDAALGSEFLDWNSRALREEEDVPILVAHCV